MDFLIAQKYEETQNASEASATAIEQYGKELTAEYVMQEIQDGMGIHELVKLQQMINAELEQRMAADL